MGSLLEEARKLVKVSVGEESGGYMNAVDVIGASASAGANAVNRFQMQTKPPVGGAKSTNTSAAANRFASGPKSATKPDPTKSKTMDRFKAKGASKPDPKKTKSIDMKKAPVRARKQLLVDASKARKRATKLGKDAIRKGLRFQPKLTKVQGAVILGATMAAALKPLAASRFTAQKRGATMAPMLRRPTGFDDIRNPRQVIVSPMGSPKSDVFNEVDKVIVHVGNGKRWVPMWNKQDHMYERPAKMTVYVRGGQPKTYTNVNTASVFGGVVVHLTNVNGDYYEIGAAGDRFKNTSSSKTPGRSVSPLASLTSAQKAKMTPKQRAKLQKLEAATNRANAAAVALVKSGQSLLKKSAQTKKFIQEQGKKIRAMRLGKTVMAGDFYEIQGDVIGDDGLWEIENTPSLMDSVRGDDAVGAGMSMSVSSTFEEKLRNAVSTLKQLTSSGYYLMQNADAQRASNSIVASAHGIARKANSENIKLVNLAGNLPYWQDIRLVRQYANEASKAIANLVELSNHLGEKDPKDKHHYFVRSERIIDRYNIANSACDKLSTAVNNGIAKIKVYDNGPQRAFRINGEIVGEVPSPPTNSHVDHDYDVVGEVPEPPTNSHVDHDYDVVGEDIGALLNPGAPVKPQRLSAVCRCPKCKTPLGLVVQPKITTKLMGCDFIAGTCCAGDDVGALMNPEPGSPNTKAIAASVQFPGIACLTTCPKCNVGLRVSIALSNKTLVEKGLVAKQVLSQTTPATVSGDEWEIANEDLTLSEELDNMRGGGETIGADAQGREYGDPDYDWTTDKSLFGDDTEAAGSPDPNSDEYDIELDPLVNPELTPIKSQVTPLDTGVSTCPADGVRYNGEQKGWPKEQFGSYCFFFGPKEVGGMSSTNDGAFGLVWGYRDADKWYLRHGQDFRGIPNWDDVQASSTDASEASRLSIAGTKKDGGGGGQGIDGRQYYDQMQKYKGPIYGPLIGNPNGPFANLRWAITDKCWFWFPSEAPDWATAEIKRAAELIKREKEKLEYEAEVTRRKDAQLIKDAEAAERARIDFETEMKYKQEDTDAAVAKSQQDRQDAATQSSLDEAQFRLDQQAQQANLDMMKMQQEFQLQAAQQQMMLQAQAQQMQLDFLKQQGSAPVDTTQYGQFALDEFGNPVADGGQGEEYSEEEYVDERGVPTPRTRTTDDDRLPPPDPNALPVVDEADYDAAMEAYNESAE